MVSTSHSPESFDVVKSYLDQHFRIVTWPAIGDLKGPRDPEWPTKQYTLSDYREGYRVGLITGIEIAPGKYLHDVDIDWSPGAAIAMKFLPATSFVFGRTSKQISHCFYTLPEPLSSFKYEDIDKTTLIELRGTKLNGAVGFQTMVPPSVWSKEGKKEPLQFVRHGLPEHIDDASKLQRYVVLAAIGMILAKHLGHHGFGHDPRLAWAGFLLRAGMSIEELVAMGEKMSEYCANKEVADVRRVVESTAAALGSDAKKVKGGPALEKIIGMNGRAVIARINEWLGRGQDYVRDRRGAILAKDQRNIKRAVEQLGYTLSYNTFADRMLINGEPLTDADIDDLYLQIDRELRFLPPFEFFYKNIKVLARANRFHPVLDYLNGLYWDGTPRIDTWLIEAGKAEDTPYVRAISAIMLIAAVRRVRQPGCKYDEMVVWESPQGTNKSSAAQALCKDPDWFSDDLRLNLQAREIIEATTGKWIVEASDLAGKRKTEVEQLKAMLSRQVDNARKAYARDTEDRPRQFIFVGTTNSHAYLTDSTGGRRFWPVKVQRFDIQWIKDCRDQLWAEAAKREANHESVRLREELWPEASREQDKRREIDPWEAAIRKKLIETEPGSGQKIRITTNALWEAVSVPIERRDRVGAVRIAEIMGRLGFERSRVRPPGEEVQVGYIQTRFDIELAEEDTREPGEDDLPI